MMVLIPSYYDICKYKNVLFRIGRKLSIYIDRHTFQALSVYHHYSSACMGNPWGNFVGLKVDGWSSIVNSSLNNLVLNFPPFIYITVVSAGELSDQTHTANILYRAAMCNYN